MQKIIEKVLEPSKIFTGSSFLLKIKAIRYLICKETKTKTCANMKKYSCGEVSGK